LPDKAILDTTPAPYTLDARGERLHTTAMENAKTSRLKKAYQDTRKIAKQLIYEARRRVKREHANATRKFFLQIHEPKLPDFQDDILLERFSETCTNYEPDIIIIVSVRLAYLLSSGKSEIAENCLTLIDAHDVQHERQSRFHSRGIMHDIDISASEEAIALSAADAVIAIQTADAAKFSEMLPATKIVVAGHPEPIYEHPQGQTANQTVRLGFVGSNMAPNREAALDLINNYYPAMRKKCDKNVELHIFGSVCDSFDSKTIAEGIILHGFVKNLTQAYAEVDVIVNPIAFGGGLKIKNVEALCHGRPLLTTPLGAEGLENGIGEAFCVAHDKAEFSELLGMLIEKPSMRKTFGDNALNYARQFLAEDASYAELDRLLSTGT